MPIQTRAMPIFDPAARARFWSYVEWTEGCWNWKGNMGSAGYGAFSIQKIRYKAHRVALALTGGGDMDGFVVDHICRNKRCVRPDHLRKTTQLYNRQNLSGARTGSASGVRGVYRHNQTGRWVAEVCFMRKRHYLGIFGTVEEASGAAKAKRLELFTHNDLDRETV